MNTKKSCLGCRAIDGRACDLGFPVKMVLMYPSDTGTPVPIDTNCPKPRTYAELAKLMGKRSA